MKITFVIGPSCSGKSTYIKEHFSDRVVVDLYDFQLQYDWLTTEDVLQSYEDCKNELIELLKEGKDVVLEHTLLKRCRRDMYIDAVRSITDDPIDIVVMKPSLEILRERSIKRNCREDDEYLNMVLDLLELPLETDGFANIIIVED